MAVCCRSEDVSTPPAAANTCSYYHYYYYYNQGIRYNITIIIIIGDDVTLGDGRAGFNNFLVEIGIQILDSHKIQYRYLHNIEYNLL